MHIKLTAFTTHCMQVQLGLYMYIRGCFKIVSISLYVQTQHYDARTCICPVSFFFKLQFLFIRKGNFAVFILQFSTPFHENIVVTYFENDSKVLLCFNENTLGIKKKKKKGRGGGGR